MPPNFRYKGHPIFKNLCDGSKDDCIYKGKRKCLEFPECFGIMYHPQRHSTLKSIKKISAIWEVALFGQFLKKNERAKVPRSDEFFSKYIDFCLGVIIQTFVPCPYIYLNLTFLALFGFWLILEYCKDSERQVDLDLYVKESGESKRFT